MKREVKVGLYMALVLLAAYWGINFLRGKDIFSRTETYYATYDQVNGVRRSSAVMLKGVKVGVVADIAYDPQKSDKVVLTFEIDKKLRIPDNSGARIYSEGLMEAKAIEIVPGDSPRYLRNRDTLHSYTDPGLLEVAGSEIERLTAKVSQVADNANRLMQSVAALVEDNRENMDAMMANVAQMTGSMNYAITGEREGLRRIVANIDEFSSALARNAEGMDATVRNLESFSGSLAGVDLERLDSSIAELDAILAGVRAGQGTLGRLAVDDGLYDELTRAAGDLSALLEDIKAHPGRYVNVSVFGRKNR